jgi:hypothetical protein
LPTPRNIHETVSAPIVSLLAHTLYHFKISVAYRGGSSSGEDATFATLGDPPSVATAPASSLTQSTVTLNARVDPEGAPVTECFFEYGRTPAYGAQARCAPMPGAGKAPVSVSAQLSGLRAASIYHYRVLASSANGSSSSSDSTFTLPPDAPTVLTESPSFVTSNSATLNASVNPNGGTLSSCEFEFDSAEERFPCQTQPATLGGAQAVSATVNGLVASASFRYRIFATNAGGSSYGSIEEFSTLMSLIVPVLPQQPTPLNPLLSPREDPRARGAQLEGATIFRANAKGVIHVHVRCASKAVRCDGTITLETLGSPRRAQVPRAGISTLATASFDAIHRRSVSVRLELSSNVRKLLLTRRALRVRLLILTGNPPDRTHPWQTLVTLTAARGRALPR